MNEPRTTDAMQYTVTVGFSQVTVEGRDREEALLAARRELSRQSPRLWDVIFNMDSCRFQVEPIT